MFHGLNMGLGNLSLLSEAKTRSISAENPTGEKGGGARAVEGTGKNCARDLGKGWKISPCIRIPAQTTVTIADIEGPGAIQSMWFTGYTGREFILRIYWEDQEIPSVAVPLPDFFAFGWNANLDDSTGRFPTLTSLPVLVAPNRGLNCFWEMPFRKRCRITMQNLGTEQHDLFYQINYTLTQVPEDAAYFHARFRRENPVGLRQDYTILEEIHGKGQYVGTALLVGLNGGGNWWGEGEIKFFLDGDGSDPTICGTGTEDYFGGAYDWDVNGEYHTYSGPFMGMYQVQKPDGLYRSQQRFSHYRWHVMDPIRFEESIRVTIQDLGWYNDGLYMPRRDDMASVAFWYQTLPSPTLPVFLDKETLAVV